MSKFFFKKKKNKIKNKNLLTILRLQPPEEEDKVVLTLSCKASLFKVLSIINNVAVAAITDGL